ncbi:unnamed protein product [Effrenium voratum]|uniref:Uncharacterized protein n=1 Tax=Effrenium voratum TaxID=2562239 RepID=A0AA36MR15_9DINO|nr:unnamed protein product [Effrenium voratum]
MLRERHRRGTLAFVLYASTSLLDAILLTANKTLKEIAGDNDFSQYVPSVLGIISSAVSAIEGLGPAANPVGTFMKDMAAIASSRRIVRSAIDAFLSRVRASSKRSAVVVDEANLGLPGLTNGQDGGERGEAKSALAAITAWTKQGKLTSVVLISSEFAYPFRLQATGLDLRDIGRVIVIGEVPKYDMLKMLQEDWGMDADLANIFYKYFGGDIYTTKQALDMLMDKKDKFNPFAVVDCPGLPSCVEDPEARAHLENMAKQGFSPVRNVKTDKGARMIAEENVGGVIQEGAITFGLPDIFTNTSCEWAVIPSSYHMRLKIADKLKNIFPSGGVQASPDSDQGGLMPCSILGVHRIEGSHLGRGLWTQRRLWTDQSANCTTMGRQHGLLELLPRPGGPGARNWLLRFLAARFVFLAFSLCRALKTFFTKEAHEAADRIPPARLRPRLRTLRDLVSERHLAVAVPVGWCFRDRKVRECDMLGKGLMTALDLQRQKSLGWARLAVEMLRAIFQLPVDYALNRIRGGGAAAKEVLDVAVSRHQINVNNFISQSISRRKIPSIIIDDANLALPGITGEDGSAAAKSALQAITKWTKQTGQASVMMISSEFGYPFRLLANGLALSIIGRVIVIGEVPKYDMLKMLQEDWGMDADLANIFYKYFGGDIYTTKQALDMLMDKKDKFNPFAVVDCPGLPSCVEDPEARAHLENMAKQGFSPVRNVKTDKGARMIAEENVGGVIKEGAITFGLPDIFTNTSCEWAVIPSSYHMRLKIADKLKNIFPSGTDATAPRAVWVRQLSKPRKDYNFDASVAFMSLFKATGLDLRDIGRVIVIGEVPKVAMLKMLQDDWGMDENLANMFYTYFGGDIYTTKQALDMLMDKKDAFDPFAAVRCPGLPSCVEDPEARAHLENMAKQGFSPVRNVKTDKGARMIAEENVGGVIEKGAITFGLPDIFTNTSCEWAVIPSSYHMRLKIADKLKNIFPSGTDTTAPRAVWVRQLSKPRKDYNFDASVAFMSLFKAVRKALLQEPPCAIDMPRVNAQGRAAAPANLVSEESCGMRALVTPQTMFFGQGGVQASPDSDQGGLMPCSILGVHRIEGHREALKLNRSLTTIQIGLNDIGDPGAEALRKVVAEKKAQGLDLTWRST